MNFEYCTTCGSKIEYLLKQPNFCPSCGIQRGKEGVKAPIPKQGLATAQTHEEDPEGTDISHLPTIHALQYELDGDYGGVGRSYGSLSDLVGAPPSKGKQDSRPKKKTKKASAKSQPPDTAAKFEAVKETLNECKSSADQSGDVSEG
tara:strand:+ start:574 stop:1014 length:441 start_codon:yes stop_codon:yes gene_type:complete